MNFFDPRFTSKGELYAPLRFKQIVNERYLISKHTNTSYSDTKDITPSERSLLLNFILDDLKMQQEIINTQKNSMKK